MRELALLHAATSGPEATGFALPPQRLAALLRALGAALPRLARLELRPAGLQSQQQWRALGQQGLPWVPEGVAGELDALGAAGIEISF